MNPLRQIALAAAVGLLAALPAMGQETAPQENQGNEYDLEMIVFLNTNTNSTEVERPNSDRLAELDRRLRQLFQRTGEITALRVTEGKMPEVAANLRNHPDYQVLQHVTWRQRVGLISDVPYVDVSALSLGEESGLKGLVRFYHSPLLYVDVFLKYLPFADPLAEPRPLPVDDIGEPGLPETGAWFLEEKRRLKLKEIHYIDSPHLGVIIGAWPIEETVE